MKRLAATLAVTAAFVGIAPTAALAGPGDGIVCHHGKTPLPVPLLIPFC